MIGIELMKWRGRRVLTIGLAITAALVAWATMAVCKLQLAATTPDSGKGAGSTVQTATQLASLLLPVLVAIVSSRVASIEHEDRMVELLNSLGVTTARLAAIKFLLVGGVVSGLIMTFWCVVSLIGGAFGARPSASQFVIVGVSLLLSTLALSAVHVALGMRFDNQWVTIGFGIVGGLIGSASLLMSPYLAILTPWTLIGGASPVRLAVIDGHAAFFNVDSVGLLLLSSIMAIAWCAVARAIVSQRGSVR